MKKKLVGQTPTYISTRTSSGKLKGNKFEQIVTPHNWFNTLNRKFSKSI